MDDVPNKLTTNPNKTELMVIGHPPKTKYLDLPEVLKLNNSDKKRVDRTKSLGVIVNEKLNWEEQLKRTEDKMSGGLVALKKLKSIIPQSQLCYVYYALIESQLHYADVIWSGLSKTILAAVLRFQDGLLNNTKCKN